MPTLTNRAETFRVELTDESWQRYVDQYGPRAREIVLTLAGQSVEHQRREREPLVLPTGADIAREYVREAGERALVDRYGINGLTRKLAGGLMSDGALATIEAGETAARNEINYSGVPSEFADRLRKCVTERREFETRCAHRADMLVTDLYPEQPANGALRVSL